MRRAVARDTLAATAASDSVMAGRCFAEAAEHGEPLGERRHELLVVGSR